MFHSLMTVNVHDSNRGEATAGTLSGCCRQRARQGSHILVPYEIVAPEEKVPRSHAAQRPRPGRARGPHVRRAAALEELLQTGSPFALVRAVELAEQVMSTGQRVPVLHTKVDGRKP